MAALTIGAAWPARADVGIPMLAVMWPPAWLLLIIIVPVEAYFARRILALDWPGALALSARANLVSTLVGIPVTWFVLALVEFGTGYVIYLLRFGDADTSPLVQRALAITVLAPWLGPGDWLSPWIVPAAAACFVGSSAYAGTRSAPPSKGQVPTAPFESCITGDLGFDIFQLDVVMGQQHQEVIDHVRSFVDDVPPPETHSCG